MEWRVEHGIGADRKLCTDDDLFGGTMTPREIIARELWRWKVLESRGVLAGWDEIDAITKHGEYGYADAILSRLGDAGYKIVLQ